MSNLDTALQEIEEVADMMADVWMLNSSPDGSSITEHGLKELSEIFGECDPGSRAGVFVKFLDYLEEEGIEYDRSLMQITKEDA